jgi:hypothetical protein
MTPDKMTELKSVAAVLREAKARIEAVHDAVDKEQQGLPKRLHSTQVDEDGAVIKESALVLRARLYVTTNSMYITRVYLEMLVRLQLPHAYIWR